MASNDLFNKMLGVNSASSNATDEKNDDVVVKQEENTEELQSEERGIVYSTDNTEVEGTEKKTQETNESAESDSTPAYVPISGDIDEHEDGDKKNLKDITSKINFKKYGIIAAVALVVIIIAYMGLGVFLPAALNASKIKKDFFTDEIGTIYSEKIEGNALKEKIFKDGLADYPEKIKDAFVDGILSESDAKKALDQLNKYSLCANSDISANKAFIENLSASNDAFEKGNEYYNAGQYEKAIVEFTKVIAEDENYETAKSKIQECSNKYKESIINSAGTAISNNNYQEAIDLLAGAKDILKEDSDISDKYNSIKKEYADYLKTKALNDAKIYMSEGNYAEAFNVIDVAIEQNPNDSELNALLSLCTSEYETKIITDTNNYIENYAFSEAMNLIEEALNVLPDNKKFIEQKTNIEKIKPVSLSSLTMLNSSDFNWNEGNPEDPFGNDYSTANNYVINTGFLGGGDYGEFRLYKKYKKLCGTIAPYTQIAENDESYIQIFADDELVYTSPSITRKTDAFTFNVSIDNAEYVKIEFHGNGNYCHVILSNLLLYSF